MVHRTIMFFPLIMWLLPKSLSVLPIADRESLNDCAFDFLFIQNAATSSNIVPYNCGAIELKEFWSQKPRIVQYPNADKAGLYTLVMYDPSVPQQLQPSHAHWIISNLPGQAIYSGDLTQGQELYSYLAPMPPTGTGKHNYIFLLYKQQEAQNVTTPADRLNFDIGEWLREQQPPLLGPIASNCRKIGITVYESNVPVVNRVKCPPRVVFNSVFVSF